MSELREGFEAWGDSELWDFSGIGPFKSPTANVAWAAWQAATKHAHAGHTQFVRAVREQAAEAIDVTVIGSKAEREFEKIIALCDAELAKEQG